MECKRTLDNQHETKSIEDQIAWSESQLSRLLEWVRAAESRLGLVLPLATAMLGTLAVLAPDKISWTVWAGIATFVSALLLLMSLVFAACASFPRTTGPKGSLIYFAGIVAKDVQQYQDAVKSMTPDSYLNDLIRQCHRNAQIAERKYTWVQRSMGCLFAAALPWFASVFILYSRDV